jgi:hypothetical protein
MDTGSVIEIRAFHFLGVGDTSGIGVGSRSHQPGVRVGIFISGVSCGVSQAVGVELVSSSRVWWAAVNTMVTTKSRKNRAMQVKLRFMWIFSLTC